jgi:hypothetical protein
VFWVRVAVEASGAGLERRVKTPINDLELPDDLRCVGGGTCWGGVMVNPAKDSCTGVVGWGKLAVDVVLT